MCHSRDVRSRDRRDTRQLAHRIIIHKIRIDGVLVGLLNGDELLRVSRSLAWMTDTAYKALCRRYIAHVLPVLVGLGEGLYRREHAAVSNQQ